MRRNAEEEEELTFQPQINPISRFFGRPDDERPEDYLMNKGRMTKEKLEKKRSEALFKRTEDCVFHPTVNKQSMRMVNER